MSSLTITEQSIPSLDGTVAIITGMHQIGQCRPGGIYIDPWLDMQEGHPELAMPPLRS